VRQCPVVWRILALDLSFRSFVVVGRAQATGTSPFSSGTGLIMTIVIAHDLLQHPLVATARLLLVPLDSPPRRSFSLWFLDLFTPNQHAHPLPLSPVATSTSFPGPSMRATRQIRAHLRHHPTVINTLRLLWIAVLLLFEVGAFVWSMSSCQWPDHVFQQVR
jgi:hypothetical protein